MNTAMLWHRRLAFLVIGLALFNILMLGLAAGPQFDEFLIDYELFIVVPLALMMIVWIMVWLGAIVIVVKSDRYEGSKKRRWLLSLWVFNFGAALWFAFKPDSEPY